MRPLRICIEDFMSHRLTDIDCTQFRSVLVVGRYRNDPRSSMGVGKSNIFKAIEYVLFGETQVKLDKIIRHGCDKCKVTFEFEMNGQSYRVVRSRFRKNSKSDLRMYQLVLDDWSDITQKTSTETEQELSSIIKISRVAFRSSILFAQADLHGLASVTPRERKAMLKEPLQISAYNKYEKIAKDKSTECLKSVDKVKTLIEGIGNPVEDLAVLDLQKIENQNKLIESENKQFALQKKIEAVHTIFVDLQKIPIVDIKEISAKLIKTQQDKKIVSEKIKNVSAFLSGNESKLESLFKEISKIESQIKSVEEISVNVLRSKIEIKNDLASMSSKEIDGKAYLSRLKTDQIKLSRTIPDGDECDHCYQPVSKDHRQTCEDKRQQDLKETILNIAKYNSVLETVKAKKARYEAELNAVEAHDSKVLTANAKLEARKKEIEQSKILVKQLKETIELRSAELKGYVDSESEFVVKEKFLQNQIREQNNDIALAQIESARQDLIKLQIEQKALNQNISSFNIALGMIEEKISARKKDKDKLDTLQTDLLLKDKELSMRLKVQQAFSSSGIPTMIINTILDDLQIVANDLLAKIRPGIEIVFLVAKTKADGQQEDTLDITYRINGIEHEYEQVSGGQKVIIALCLKMGLSLIIQHRIGVDIKFLMLDEVDSQFDESALEAFIEVIKKWQDKFTIFVITHNKDLKDKFGHAILVEGDDVNGSTGSLVNSW